MKTNFYSITIQQTNIIKAIGISLIVFHNYLHWTTQPLWENEMSLDPQRIFHLFDFIKNNPLRIFDGLFTYFGHFGVELFIFISGYGLSKQFMKHNPGLSFKSYIKYLTPRLIKIYGLMLFAIVTCAILFIIDIPLYSYYVLLLITGIKNLSYDNMFYILGPWWYFVLAIQLYFVFPFYYYIIDKYETKGLIISILFVYAAIFCLYPYTERLNLPMYGNFLGHSAEFILGIGLARIKNINIGFKEFFLALILFSLANHYQAFFPFSFLSVTVLFLVTIHAIMKYVPEKMKEKLMFVGSISMFMFIVNGPLRHVTCYFTVMRYDFLNPFLFSIMHYAIAVGIAYYMSVQYQKLRNVVKDKLHISI